ncbi:Bro-N domain-containing protein, partial [Aduncisulcus paluster]
MSDKIIPFDFGDRVVRIHGQGGRKQEFTIISESGLYSLIFKSRKPEAKKFRRWVTSEVLPTLRERGCYALGDGDPENEESASTPSLPFDLEKLPRLR